MKKASFVLDVLLPAVVLRSSTKAIGPGLRFLAFF
jgi:hypothetical protein